MAVQYSADATLSDIREGWWRLRNGWRCLERARSTHGLLREGGDIGGRVCAEVSGPVPGRQGHHSDAEFRILDRLFADVDAFCGDPSIRSADGLDELELRNRCVEALVALRSLAQRR